MCEYYYPVDFDAENAFLELQFDVDRENFRAEWFEYIEEFNT